MTRHSVVLFVMFSFDATRLKFHKVSRNRDSSSPLLFLSFHHVTLSGFSIIIVLAGALKFDPAPHLTPF